MAIRKLLKSGQWGEFTVGDVEQTLGTDPLTATQIVSELLREGYIKEIEGA